MAYLYQNVVVLTGLICTDMFLSNDKKSIVFKVAVNNVGTDKTDYIFCRCFSEVAKRMLSLNPQKGQPITLQGSLKTHEGRYNVLVYHFHLG